MDTQQRGLTAFIYSMDFSKALSILKEGGTVTRAGWNGKGMYITLQRPDENSKMTRPYVYMTLPVGSTAQFGEVSSDQRVPWLCSQTDLLAEDWETVA